MDHLFDKQSLDFNCPNCGRRITKTVAELKRPGQKCPHCGAVMETSGFKRGIDKADRRVEQFKRQLGNMKLNIKL